MFISMSVPLSLRLVNEQFNHLLHNNAFEIKCIRKKKYGNGVNAQVPII